MGLQTGLAGSLKGFNRIIRILGRKLILLLHLLLRLPNYNSRTPNSGIPSPRYYNSRQEISAMRKFYGNLWTNDLVSQLQDDQVFNQKYGIYDYDIIVKAYFPTKNSALQSVNMQRIWSTSFWNPKNTTKHNKEKIYKKSDVLFADMMTNAQGIYKIKKVNDGSIKNKVKLFFGDMLEENRSVFCEAEQGKSVIDSLVAKNNLYFLDYPNMREIETKQKDGKKYFQQITSINGKKYPAYFEIPFAIFAKVQNYLTDGEQEFVCLGTVFNDTFYKTQKKQISSDEIFTCLSDDPLSRDRWQIAKSHMAAVDLNDFTMRIHLGQLHFGSAPYTCALFNLSKKKKEWGWLKTEFVDIFSSGLLQVNFLGTQTLVDHKQPLLGKLFYLSSEKIVNILKSNDKFNILNFDPNHLGKDSYESDAVKMSLGFYEKLEEYIDFLLWKHKKSWESKTKQMGKILYNQLGDKTGRFDALPSSITEDQTPESLKRILANLAYIWIVYHGETFSMVSVNNNFYFAPSFLRKPASSMNGRKACLTDAQKQDFLPPSDIIKNAMTLTKTVTFRGDADSIVSKWANIPAKNSQWDNFQHQYRDNCINFYDFWNDLSLKHYQINYERTMKGKFNLHWLLPNELPISLTI